MDAAALIAPQVRRFHADFHLKPITASEIEFYLTGSDSNPALPAFWQDVSQGCKSLGIGVANMEKEKGREQHEISILPSNDPIKTARDTQALKIIISETAGRHNMRADFSARPFADEPGSGLHIHVHLAD